MQSRRQVYLSSKANPNKHTKHTHVSSLEVWGGAPITFAPELRTQEMLGRDWESISLTLTVKSL